MMKKPIKTAMPKVAAGKKIAKPLVVKSPVKTSVSISTANGRRAVN
jgi:hypothetical protein